MAPTDRRWPCDQNTNFGKIGSAGSWDGSLSPTLVRPRWWWGETSGNWPPTQRP